MLTVLFSTYNGARVLPMTLEAMTRLQEPEGGWRLVVADNGSEDRSAAILQSYRERLPLVYVKEPRRGKNRALNTALESAEGDLYVFTDDDVIPDEAWLVQLRQTANSKPHYGMFGGAILPYWESEPEDWVTRMVPLGVAYALTDPELSDGPVSPALVWGPNMAVRREIFDAGHRFEESIGPNGSQYAMGSETEFALRISQQGVASWFCRNAVVRHIIRAHQIEKSWILSRAFRSGRGLYRRQLTVGKKSGPEMFGVPRWIIRQIAGQVMAACKATIWGDVDKAFDARWSLEVYRGYLYEARLLGKGQAPSAR